MKTCSLKSIQESGWNAHRCSAAAHPLLLLLLIMLFAGLQASAAQAHLADGLVAYWNFNTDFTATYGGPAYDGIPVNGPSIEANGRFGSGVRFERSYGEYIDVPAPVIQSGRDHTYSAWYKLDVALIAPSSNRYFVLETKGVGGADAFVASYGLRGYLKQTFPPQIYDVGQFFTQWSGGSRASDIREAAGTGWHNIVVTYDANNVGAEHSLYLDGQFVRSLSTAPVLLETTGLIIGGHRAGTGRNWQGMIDEVGFWNRVLTPAEISEVYNRPIIPGFTDMASGLPGVSNGSTSWGDYDSDGDLDILLTGDSDSGPVSQVYLNDDGGYFSLAPVTLPGVSSSSSAWGDYDNDGDLDILLTGNTGSARISRLLRNDGANVFVEVATGWPGVDQGAVAWGDYDNDGDLDVLLTGNTGSAPTTQLLRNDGADVFTAVAVGLLEVDESSVAWGDYDNDGDLDILLSGTTSTGAAVSKLYRNDGADVFTAIASGMADLGRGSVAWGDYDSDGDLDILQTGLLGSTPSTRIYRNDGLDLFTDIGAGLPGVSNGSAAWGDSDNDGDLDILLVGRTSGAVATAQVFRNDGAAGFKDIDAGMTGVEQGAAAWGDADNDGDLDVLLMGWTGSAHVTLLYANGCPSANTFPSAPTNLTSRLVGDRLVLSWSASSDAQTPSSGLSYNLRVGTTEQGGDVCSPMSNPLDGFRQVVRRGNVSQGETWTMSLPAPGLYYWTVQAVDGAFAGSEFAPVQFGGNTDGTPDLVIDSSDVSHLPVGTDLWRLTATVHNRGDGWAAGTIVRFYDGLLAASIGEVPIAMLAPGDSTSCTIDWVRECSRDLVQVHVDPDAAVREQSDTNNAAIYVIHGVTPCVAPRVATVTATFGDMGQPDTFGKYVKGIAGTKEVFTATVVDDDVVTTGVRFVIAETDTFWAAKKSTGWVIEYDPGWLTAAESSMEVQVFSSAGPTPVSWVGTLMTQTTPDWLSRWFNLPGSSASSAKTAIETNLPVNFKTIDGHKYLVVWLKFQSERSPDSTGTEPGFFEWGNDIDPKTPFFGNKGADFKVGLELELSIPLEAGANWIGRGSVERNCSIFGKKPKKFSEATRGNELRLEFHGSNLVKAEFTDQGKFVVFEFPEQERVFYSGGLQITIGFSMDLFLEYFLKFEENNNFEAWACSLYAGVGVEPEIKGTVSLPALKFAKVQVIISPQFGFGPSMKIEKKMGQDWDFGVGGQAYIRIDGRIVASITYKVWKYKKRKSWEVANFQIWEKHWGFSLTEEKLLAALADSGEIYVPNVFPYPNAAGHPESGKVGVVWINDVNADTLDVDPQVYFAQRDTSGVWSAAVPVTTDDLFKSYATLAYLSDSRPLAVWVQASQTAAETDSNLTLSDVLDRQDLWYAIGDSLGWIAAPVFTEPGSYRADGVPAAATTDGGAVLVWTRDAAGLGALTSGCSEIYFSKYSSGSWSPPVGLTNDTLDDTGPAVCSRGDSVIVLWLRDNPGLANELVWSMWDGNDWQARDVLSGSNWTKQPASVTSTTDGVVLATWVEKELSLPDSNVVYHLRSATLEPGTTQWSSIQDVLSDSLIIETPVVIVDKRNIAAVTWRGYNGMDGDLWVSLRDLGAPGSAWTMPRLITDDNLTDWMATAVVDPDNNLHVIEMKSDLGNPPQLSKATSNFPGGLTLISRGIGKGLSLTEELNVGYRPMSCDLWLGDASLRIDDEMPVLGNPVPLVAVVKNIGDYVSEQSLLRFYDDHPDVGSPLPGDLTIPALAPDDSFVVQAEWTVVAGSHRLYAFVDPDSTLSEQSNSNNLASVQVNVVPDVAVDSVRVTDVNPEPGVTDTLLAYLRNGGGAPAEDFIVRFLARNGTIANQMIGSLAPGDAVRLAQPFTTVLGIDTLRVFADPESLLAEVDSTRTDNRRAEALYVLPDLGIPFESFGFTQNQLVGTLTNLGGVNWDGNGQGDTLIVRVYAGNPRGNGVQVLPDIPIWIPPKCFDVTIPGFPNPTTITVCDGCVSYLGVEYCLDESGCVTFLGQEYCLGGLAPGSTMQLPPIDWDIVANAIELLGLPLDSGRLPRDPTTFYVVIDPDGDIPDRNKANNTVYVTIGQGSPQLAIESDSITLDRSAGDQDMLHARIVNRGSVLSFAIPVQFYIGHPDSGGTALGDRLIPSLVAGATADVSIPLLVPSEAFKVFVVVDGDNRIVEYDETDNLASQVFEPTPVLVSDMAVAMAGTAVELSWTLYATEDVAGFRVHRSVDGVTFAPLTESPLQAKKGRMTYRDPAAGVAPGTELIYQVEGLLSSGKSELVGGQLRITFTPPLPKQAALYQNAPNPFNPITVIRYDLPREEHVSLKIYDVAGRLVRSLVNEKVPAGFARSATWNGLDNAGRKVASGVYFYRLIAGDYIATRKLVVMK